jgi:hypothetical protein
MYSLTSQRKGPRAVERFGVAGCTIKLVVVLGMRLIFPHVNMYWLFLLEKFLHYFVRLQKKKLQIFYLFFGSD